jgi:hypothetical protein
MEQHGGQLPLVIGTVLAKPSGLIRVFANDLGTDE